MSLHWQQIIVALIVFACAGRLGWRVLRGGKAGCGSCGSCAKTAAPNGTPVVTLDHLRESARRN